MRPGARLLEQDLAFELVEVNGVVVTLSMRSSRQSEEEARMLQLSSKDYNNGDCTVMVVDEQHYVLQGISTEDGMFDFRLAKAYFPPLPDYVDIEEELPTHRPATPPQDDSCDSQFARDLQSSANLELLRSEQGSVVFNDRLAFTYNREDDDRILIFIDDPFAEQTNSMIAVSHNSDVENGLGSVIEQAARTFVFQTIQALDELLVFRVAEVSLPADKSKTKDCNCQ